MASAAFATQSTTNMQNGYSPFQFIFGYDIILPIKHRVDWQLIRYQKQTQVNKYNTRKNRHRVDYDYKVGDKVMITQHTAYKYKTPYIGPFVITKFWTNGMISLKIGAT